MPCERIVLIVNAIQGREEGRNRCVYAGCMRRRYWNLVSRILQYFKESIERFQTGCKLLVNMTRNRDS